MTMVWVVLQSLKLSNLHIDWFSKYLSSKFKVIWEIRNFRETSASFCGKIRALIYMRFFLVIHSSVNFPILIKPVSLLFVSIGWKIIRRWSERIHISMWPSSIRRNSIGSRLEIIKAKLTSLAFPYWWKHEEEFSTIIPKITKLWFIDLMQDRSLWSHLYQFKV